MLTVSCIAVALTLGYCTGVPLLWIARGGRSLNEMDWLWAPFIGIGTLILIVHQLVYLDITVAQSTPFFWAAIASCWIVLICGYGWRTPFQNCPWRVLVAVCVVYLVHGAGMLLLGAESYFGRAYTDRFNYISLSQFVSEAPFSLSWERLDHRAYLADGLKIKNERIGVTTLQAFIACTLRVPTADTFDPAMLLGPAFVVSALALFSRLCSFSQRGSLSIGMAAGLLPGLATIQLSSFLGQVIATPFLFASAVAAGMLAARWTFRRLLLTAFLFAATVSIYLEFAPLLMAILVGAVLASLWIGTLRIRTAALLIPTVLLLSLAIYPQFILASQYSLVGRAATNTSHSDWPCSWLSGFREFGAIWLSDQAVLHRGEPARTGAKVIGLLLTLCAAFGLVRTAWNALCFRLTAPLLTPEGCTLAILAAALGIGPFIVLAHPRFEYQSVKLMITISPVWVMGLGFELRRRSIARTQELSQSAWARFVLSPYSLGISIILLGLCAVWQTTEVSTTGHVDYSLHSHLLDPSVRQVRSQLEHYRAESIVLACGSGHIWNSYLSYAARNNQVWLANPIINDRISLGCTHVNDTKYIPFANGRELVDLSTVPPGSLVLTRTDDQKQIDIEGDRTLSWETGVFQVWRVGPGPFHLIPTEKAQRPKELDQPARGSIARSP
jgi:hypothetical protein